MFGRKQPQVQPADEDRHADLIDLLLDADDPTRRQIMLQIVQSGALNRKEADALLARVVRLERLAGPHQAAPTTASEPLGAWGIDYP